MGAILDLLFHSVVAIFGDWEGFGVGLVRGSGSGGEVVGGNGGEVRGGGN